jgi:hypothetical protein
MKDTNTRLRAPLRRETNHKEWYRTLFFSYLHRPPIWVYVVEMIVAILAVYILLEHDSEVVSILIILLSEMRS